MEAEAEGGPSLFSVVLSATASCRLLNKLGADWPRQSCARSRTALIASPPESEASTSPQDEPSGTNFVAGQDDLAYLFDLDKVSSPEPRASSRSPPQY